MKRFSTNLTLIYFLLITPFCFSQIPLNFGSNIKTADPSGHVWKDGKL
jgi:hypothetical protein